MSGPDTENLSLEAATALIGAALSACGASPLQANSTARALVAAEAEGQVGHGFSRLADYAAQLRSGKVRGDAEPRVTRDLPAYLRIDAGHGFAFPALDVAVEQGAEVATQTGCAAMAITHSHHCGALSIQVERLAEAGLIGLMVANAPAAIAPWGAHTPVYGTNPIAFAAPRPGQAPLVIDLSLSRVARGKVMHAHKSGQPIPEGWALDETGASTTDPGRALQGSMVPIGEAKGTALALMVEILASVLTGASLSKDMSSFFTGDGPPPDAGQFLLAISPAVSPGFAERLESLLTLVAGLEGARLPGTRRLAARQKARQDGLDVPRSYVEQARALAGETG